MYGSIQSGASGKFSFSISQVLLGFEGKQEGRHFTFQPRNGWTDDHD